MQTLMKIFLVALFSFGFVACDDGPFEEAGNEIDEGLEEVGDEIDDAN